MKNETKNGQTETTIGFCGLLGAIFCGWVVGNLLASSEMTHEIETDGEIND